MRVDERGPRHLKQLFVRNDQHLLGAFEMLFHRRHQRRVELAQQRLFARLFAQQRLFLSLDICCRCLFFRFLTPTLLVKKFADFALGAWL